VPAAEPAEAKQAALPVAKKVPPKPAPQAAARPEPVHEAKAGPKREAKPEKAPVQAAGAPATTPAVTKARPEADRRIAAAVARRAQQLQREGAAAAAKSEVEQRIAAAVERRARIVQGGSADGGGPITSGPGSGAGGVVRGVDYILYRGHMEERIKAAWVWAGANRSLRAVVRFNLLPSGEIVNVQIVTASGDPSYDASIERALRRASPLDPPPERYRDEFSTVELEFRPEDLQS
jgi:colicin import membrane protein